MDILTLIQADSVIPKNAIRNKLHLCSIGQQRRKISCFWSGRNCFDFRNKEEVENYCSYGKFFDDFCDFDFQWHATKKCKVKETSTSQQSARREFACENQSKKKRGGQWECPENKVMGEIVKKCDHMWTKISQEIDSQTKKYFR